MLQIRPASLDHPDVTALIEQVQEFYTERYGEPDVTPIAPGEFAAPEGHFLLGTVDGTAVACGGWRAHPAPSGDAELKRMFVAPAVRGKGFARALLAELERTAQHAGRTRMVLETGVHQPEAIALYTTSGYREIAKFGYYKEQPTSRCYAKELTS